MEKLYISEGLIKPQKSPAFKPGMNAEQLPRRVPDFTLAYRTAKYSLVRKCRRDFPGILRHGVNQERNPGL
jgi:hypothetical protein